MTMKTRRSPPSASFPPLPTTTTGRGATTTTVTTGTTAEWCEGAGLATKMIVTPDMYVLSNRGNGINNASANPGGNGNGSGSGSGGNNRGAVAVMGGATPATAASGNSGLWGNESNVNGGYGGSENVNKMGSYYQQRHQKSNHIGGGGGGSGGKKMEYGLSPFGNPGGVSQAPVQPAALNGFGSYKEKRATPVVVPPPSSVSTYECSRGGGPITAPSVMITPCAQRSPAQFPQSGPPTQPPTARIGAGNPQSVLGPSTGGPGFGASPPQVSPAVSFASGASTSPADSQNTNLGRGRGKVSFAPPQIPDSTFTVEEGRSIPYREIEIKTKIGEGQFGLVYSALCRQKLVAVKILAVNNCDEELIENCKKEVEIMSKVSHPNLCLYMGVCTECEGRLLIITELYKESLDHILFSTQYLSFPLRMRMASDVALGMNWLHCSNPKLVHSDLKVNNILVAENYRCVVSDFGQTEILRGITKDINSWGGTPLYMAPEKLQGYPHNDKIDVYSFGLVLWEMCTRKRAFETYVKRMSLPALIAAVCERQERPIIPEEYPDSLKKLISSCWAPDPEKRPTFAKIVEMMPEIVVDTSFTDPNARAFWKTHFGTATSVDWKSFSKRLCAYTGRASTFWLKALLSEKQPSSSYSSTPTKQEATCELFGNMVAYFGPLIPEPSEKAKIFSVPPIKSTNFLDKVQNTLMAPWFHGDLDSAEAARLLRASTHSSSFLVRFSAREPGTFTLSRMFTPGVILSSTNTTTSSPSASTTSTSSASSSSAAPTKVTADREIQHHRIPNTPRGLMFGASSFPTLSAFVKKASSVLILTHPVHPSPFHQLFYIWTAKLQKKDTSQGSGVYMIVSPHDHPSQQNQPTQTTPTQQPSEKSATATPLPTTRALKRS
ncbi:SHK1 protein [Pelomyxa schiedti]|nr:SHK1 protein [Pelomyxa schiedti]